MNLIYFPKLGRRHEIPELLNDENLKVIPIFVCLFVCSGGDVQVSLISTDCFCTGWEIHYTDYNQLSEPRRLEIFSLSAPM